MKNIKRILRIIIRPHLVASRMLPFISKHIKSDKLYIKLFYTSYTLKKMDFKNPITFTQKIQFLKLQNTSPLCTQMVDKFEARSLVANKIGEEYLIPLLGVWDKFDDIDFDTLPEQFVIKTTHDSGGLSICKDKNKFDVAVAESKINKSLKRNYFWNGREYPYKNVTPRIIAEKYMKDDARDELLDYKFFCFNGEPKFVQLDTNRFVNRNTDFYDTNWNKLPFYSKSIKQISDIAPKPHKLDEMLDIAKVLSKGFAFLRVDLYLINESVYFGELTFHPDGGVIPFIPKDWEVEIGKMIKLNTDSNE